MLKAIRKLGLTLVIGCVLLALLAGCAPGGSCRTWDQPVPINKAAADRLQVKIDNDFHAKRSGPFSLEITQEEATSYLAFNLRDYPIGNPEVRFSQGLVYLSGEVVIVGPAKAKFSAAFLPQLVNGQVSLQIKEVCALGISAPQFISDRISQIVNDSIAEARTYARIRQLQILEGRIVTSGEII